jgi:[acyl-carrier-protein] S-malonyltransferase
LNLAFVFPGQGSQSVGMQADLPDTYKVARETYDEASNVLGFDLLDLVANGPAQTLDDTVNTQPAMLAAGVATWRAWVASGGPQPAMMAGHSLGEYTALVCAGVLEFADAVGLVRRRAELMQGAVPAGEGAMAAILGLDDDVVATVCEAASESGVAEPVNFNSPGQVVVAGASVAIDRVLELAKEAGARRALKLAVSVPAHSSLMRPAGEKLAESLAATKFAEPAVTVICAVDGTPYAGPDDIQRRMQAQVYSPVRWVQTVGHMAAGGVTHVAECGPGKVLAGLNRRIDRSLAATALDSSAAIQTFLTEISA